MALNRESTAFGVMEEAPGDKPKQYYFLETNGIDTPDQPRVPSPFPRRQ
jgi:hypothetical protein